MTGISNFIMNFVNGLGIYGIILSCLLILVESIIPVLPLAVFITFNFLNFGSLFGFILSWVFTVFGCILSYFIFKKGFGNKFSNLTKDKDKLNNLLFKFNNINMSELVVIVAIPFAPAFLLNIAAGLSNMDFKKFLVAILIGKLSIVYFWGYIGTSLIESFSNPIIILKIIIIMVIVYLISLILKKVLKI